jgi:hypothetical protein
MPAHDSKPTRRQLRYLRQLAEQTGTSFTAPRTFAEARRAIDRLKQRPRSLRFERQADRDAVSRGLAQGPSSSLRDDEIAGYGGDCRWAHSEPDD